MGSIHPTAMKKIFESDAYEALGRREAWVTDEAELAVAEQHIIEAERNIARHIQAIALLKLRGLDTAEAEQTLASFKESVKAFRRYRDSILENLGRETW
jgi:hypothetical protein